MRRKRIITLFLLLVLLTLAVVWYCDKRVTLAAENKTFNEAAQTPHNHIGLLLGTGKYLKGGFLNPYYTYRIDAASQLLKSNRIDYLVISGDNSRKDYNEPEMMRADLMAEGIDSARIFLDYAGFRTFDSMIRLKEVFSRDTVTIISQQFHNERALYIARREGMSAIGFNAKDVSRTAGLKTQLREKLARVKVFTDYLFHATPKYLGPKVDIP